MSTRRTAIADTVGKRRVQTVIKNGIFIVSYGVCLPEVAEFCIYTAQTVSTSPHMERLTRASPTEARSYSGKLHIANCDYVTRLIFFDAPY